MTHNLSKQDTERFGEIVKALTNIQTAKHVESFIERSGDAIMGIMQLGRSMDEYIKKFGEEEALSMSAFYLSLYAGAIYSDGIKGTNYGAELYQILITVGGDDSGI